MNLLVICSEIPTRRPLEWPGASLRGRKEGPRTRTRTSRTLLLDKNTELRHLFIALQHAGNHQTCGSMMKYVGAWKDGEANWNQTMTKWQPSKSHYFCHTGQICTVVSEPRWPNQTHRWYLKTVSSDILTCCLPYISAWPTPAYVHLQ